MNYVLPNSNDKYKYILFRVPKNANSCLIGRENENHQHLAINYITDNRLQKLDDVKTLFKEKYNSYFKFAVVRNPWDRVVSCWKDKTAPAHCDSWPDSVYCKARNDTFSKFIARIINKEFIEFINDPEFSIDDRHVLSQTVLIPDDTDFICRFENLQEDFNTVCNKIGIPQQQLPHINKTEHTYYTEYYTDETKELIANKYSKDIEHFGYKFDKSKNDG